jgi:hypothetical protein
MSNELQCPVCASLYFSDVSKLDINTGMTPEEGPHAKPVVQCANCQALLEVNLPDGGNPASLTVLTRIRH